MKNFSLKNSKLGRTLGKKGLYITIGAFMLALAGAGVAAYNKAMDTIDQTLIVAQPDSASPLPAENKVTDVPKQTTATEKAPESKPDSEHDLDKKTQPTIMPVAGEIIENFSNGELVKSETLGVWKTHDGIDIKADLGAPVKAINKGKVIKVWSDPLWGSCVKIDHGSGMTAHYYGLSSSVSVSEGDFVNSGDVIGAVGDTAQIEIAQPTHLHFALERNGSWIDPVDILDPSSK